MLGVNCSHLTSQIACPPIAHSLSMHDMRSDITIYDVLHFAQTYEVQRCHPCVSAPGIALLPSKICSTFTTTMSITPESRQEER